MSSQSVSQSVSIFHERCPAKECSMAKSGKAKRAAAKRKAQVPIPKGTHKRSKYALKKRRNDRGLFGSQSPFRRDES